MKPMLLALAGSVIAVTSADAQSVSNSAVNSSGNTYKSGYYQFEWSIGEMSLVNEMKSGDKQYIITNGLLQPNESTHENPDKQFDKDEIKVFANPSTGMVDVNILTKQQGKLTIRVFDVQGKLLATKNAISYGFGSTEKIDLTRYAASTYFLKIDLNPAPGSVRKTGGFKITKL